MNINAGGESGKREPRQHIEGAFHPMPGPPRPLSRITVGEPSPLLEWLSVRPPPEPVGGASPPRLRSTDAGRVPDCSSRSPRDRTSTPRRRSPLMPGPIGPWVMSR